MRLTILILLTAFMILAFGCKEEEEKVEPDKGTPPPTSQDSTEKAPEVPETITGNELAVITMEDGGEIVITFYYDDAPKTVENFIALARRGFYDGLTFHRIVSNFVVQGGDPLGTGTGNAGYNIASEFNKKPFVPGVLGMARGPDPNSASCQFFICLTREKCKHLDGDYTAFGEVIKGMEIVRKIGKAKVDESGMPIKPIKMKSVTIQMAE